MCGRVLSSRYRGENAAKTRRAMCVMSLSDLRCRVQKLQMQSPSPAESRIAQLLEQKEGIYISGEADFAQMTLNKHKELQIWITYVLLIKQLH